MPCSSGHPAIAFWVRIRRQDTTSSSRTVVLGRTSPRSCRTTSPKSVKPRTASLFKTMSLDTVTLEDALRLLTLPRVLGVDPADGVEVSALNGRYGPYVRKGSESRSLADEESLFTVTLDDALALLVQPRQRGRRGGPPAAPLRELGADPTSGNPIVVREGRVRALRDGRRGQRQPAQGRRRGDADGRAGRGAAGRKAGQGPVDAAQARHGDHREEDHKTTAKKTTAKKTTAKKTTAKRHLSLTPRSLPPRSPPLRSLPPRSHRPRSLPHVAGGDALGTAVLRVIDRR